jgi:hypothetical protein
LPVKSVLGGQIDFGRDKVGDTDSNILFVRFFSLCDTLMLAVPWGPWEHEGNERMLKICLCLSKILWRVVPLYKFWGLIYF